uniref:OTU domain-containing protein n=1 Tax=viral metagenome TaxID=1070528 RepID=A0A6C0KUM5_9ZZZZ
MPLQWIRKHIIGDGNCFYRAIYNSSIETGNLKKIIACFDLYKNPIAASSNASANEINEVSFIVELRKALSNRIISKKDHNITSDIYEYLKTLDKETYKAVLDAFPSWCHKSLKKLPKTIDKFRDKFARHILKQKTWISELEARLVIEIISKYRKGIIKIKIHNTFPAKSEQLDCKTMHLINENEVHYNILVCRECPANKIVNPKTRRCVSEKGIIGQRLRNF